METKTERITITLSLTPDELWTLYKITYNAGGNFYEHERSDARMLTSIAMRVERAARIAKGLPADGADCAVCREDRS